MLKHFFQLQKIPISIEIVHFGFTILFDQFTRFLFLKAYFENLSNSL